jgi:inosine/guanosine/xanthosine phosphorylase family protein
MNDAHAAADFLRSRWGDARPRVAVVLGSGLGEIAEGLDERRSLPSETIPGIPKATVEGHAGEVHIGRWGSSSVLVFQGRVHFYEGHSFDTITLAVRTAAELGVRDLILTNAAGSCDGALPPGALMRATDLIDLFFRRNRGTSAPVWIGRGGVLDRDLGRILDDAAIAERIEMRLGVLCGSQGPTYETASEIRLWRKIGASAACMSTVPEAFAARAAGMRVAAISMISNFGTGVTPGRIDHEEVMREGRRAGKDLGRLLRRAISLLC